MARAHEPANGSDHPPPNGNRGRQVAIALFIATTFGIMAILSFPLAGVRVPPNLPRPLETALSPIERLIRPLIPWLGQPSGNRAPKVSVALGPRRPGGVTSAGPSGPSGPVPAPPPPQGGAPTTLTRTGPQTVRTLAPTVVRQVRHESKQRNLGRTRGPAKGSSRTTEGRSRGRGRGRGHGHKHKPEANGVLGRGHSHERHGKDVKHWKRPKKRNHHTTDHGQGNG